jgi:hypothetical protein
MDCPSLSVVPAPKMRPSASYDAMSMTVSGMAALFCQATANKTQAANATMLALDLMRAIAVNKEFRGHGASPVLTVPLCIETLWHMTPFRLCPQRASNRRSPCTPSRS